MSQDQRTRFVVVLAILAAVLTSGAFGCRSSGNAMPASTTTTTTGAVSSPGLDGKSYDVVLELAGEQPLKDSLRFSNGKFESTACTAVGFPEWTDYTVTPRRDRTTFHVVTTNPEGVTMDWTGRSTPNGIEGSVVRVAEGRMVTGHFQEMAVSK